MTTDSVINEDEAANETKPSSESFGGIPEGQGEVQGGSGDHQFVSECEANTNGNQSFQGQRESQSQDGNQNQEEYMYDDQDQESLAASSLGTSIEINLINDCGQSVTSASTTSVTNSKAATSILTHSTGLNGRGSPMTTGRGSPLTRGLRQGRGQRPQRNNGHSSPLVCSPSPTPPASMTYPPEDAPLCSTCCQLDCAFFNVECMGCWKRLEEPDIRIGHIFAIIRQWVPEIQESISILIKEMLRRGAGVNDRDGLTDMTMLHYAVKAGSMTIGSSVPGDDERGEKALEAVRMLVEEFGADVSLKCRWNDMSALHYAVFFDVPIIVDYLLMVTQNAFIDDPCTDFDGGTPLHIASHTAALESAKILIRRGANVLLKDSLGRTALDCVPDIKSVVKGNFISLEAAKDTIYHLTKLLEEATVACIPGEGSSISSENGNNLASVNGKVVLRALGLRLNDRVIVGGSNGKVGILRYCGATQFANGIWAGVELEEPEGRNDGTVGGVTYFRCPPNCGLFAPIAKVSKINQESPRRLAARSSNLSTSSTVPYSSPQRPVNFPRVDVSKITSKIETGLSNLKANSQPKPPPFEINVGDKVLLTDHRRGIVRFIGETQFAPGTWYGIELSKPKGKNNGSVNGVDYFTCKPNHGVFANVSRIARILRKAGEFEEGENEEDEEDNDSNLSLCLSRCSIDADHGAQSLSMSQRTLIRSTKGHPYKSTKSSSSNSSWLKVGVNVYVNNQVGILRYIGPVHFADGVWLGVELRTAAGKNDGMVNGKRYFTCKPNHGLLARPKKVNVRGINGSKLIPDNCSSTCPPTSSSLPTSSSHSSSANSSNKITTTNPTTAIQSSNNTTVISNGSPSKTPFN